MHSSAPRLHDSARWPACFNVLSGQLLQAMEARMSAAACNCWAAPHASTTSSASSQPAAVLYQCLALLLPGSSPMVHLPPPSQPAAGASGD